ncbi:MAG: sugar phosphate isomerase/epimerase [Clostridia bacterium]|nr:sugar phosphate isomerase/epimerase [Clostridia bacterium]
MKYPVAIQVYSLREEANEDFYGTLKKIKEMGYDGVEFAGLYGNSPEDVKKWCEELSLTIISAHVPFQDLLTKENILETYKDLGCKYVVIPYITNDYCPGNPLFPEMVEKVTALGKKARELGMKLGYHNHDFEFSKYEGKYLLDIIYDSIPAESLQTQLDSCWVTVGGEDVCKYIKKYADRSELLHVKDFVGRRGENMYNLIGIDDDQKKKTDGAFEQRPVGYGVQNFKKIIDTAKESNIKWLIVEQDNPTPGMTALECAKKSLDFLKSLED